MLRSRCASKISMVSGSIGDLANSSGLEEAGYSVSRYNASRHATGLALMSQIELPVSGLPNELQATRVRYGVLAFSVGMSVLLYLDRMAIAVPVKAIAADLKLTDEQVGDSMAAFFWCYALCQVPAGWLGDRWGGRRALRCTWWPGVRRPPDWDSPRDLSR